MGEAVNTCTHVKDDGSRCGVHWGLVDGKCMSHDPERREKASAIRRAGTQASRLASKGTKGARVALPEDVPAPLQTPQCAVTWASWLATAVATGGVDVRTAREIAGAIREFRAAYETAEMANELDRLRAEVARLKRGR